MLMRKINYETTVNMTSKGQVLIPKALRELGGLVPNGPVRVGRNDRGETVILPARPYGDESREQRIARIRAALESAQGAIDLGGLTTDEYMRELRGDLEP